MIRIVVLLRATVKFKLLENIDYSGVTSTSVGFLYFLGGFVIILLVSSMSDVLSFFSWSSASFFLNFS